MAKNLFLTINENVVKQIKESDEDVKLDVKNLAYKNIEIITPNYLTTIESMLETRPEVRDIPSEMAYLKFFMSFSSQTPSPFPHPSTYLLWKP